MTDILNRIDAVVAELCPCGGTPRPGSPWCSEDCEPAPGAGRDYAGERWTEDGPAMAVAETSYDERPRGVPCNCGVRPGVHYAAAGCRSPRTGGDPNEIVTIRLPWASHGIDQATWERGRNTSNQLLRAVVEYPRRTTYGLAEMRVGSEVWDNLRRAAAPDVSPEIGRGQLFGVPIRVDEGLAPGEWRLIDGRGDVASMGQIPVRPQWREPEEQASDPAPVVSVPQGVTYDRTIVDETRPGPVCWDIDRNVPCQEVGCHETTAPPSARTVAPPAARMFLASNPGAPGPESEWIDMGPASDFVMELARDQEADWDQDVEGRQAASNYLHYRQRWIVGLIPDHVVAPECLRFDPPPRERATREEVDERAAQALSTHVDSLLLWDDPDRDVAEGIRQHVRRLRGIDESRS